MTSYPPHHPRPDTTPDLQAEPHMGPPLRLDSVGVRDVIRVTELAGRPYRLAISANVALDGRTRGAHMSRFVTTIDRALAELGNSSPDMTDDGEALLQLAERLAGAAAEDQSSSSAEALVQAESTRTSGLPDASQALAPRRVLASASRTASTAARRLGVEVLGMTACPCAQALVRAQAREKLEEVLHTRVPALDSATADELVDEILTTVPVATHNQRSWMTLVVGGQNTTLLTVRELEQICESAMSAPVVDMLKRPNERDVVVHAHTHPRFVEDAIREALAAVARTPLSDETSVEVRVRNEESIHPHDVEASRTALLGTIRAELG